MSLRKAMSLHVNAGTVSVWVAGWAVPAEITEREACHRLLAFDTLLAALAGLIAAVERDASDPAKGISGYTGARLTDARAALAAAKGE